MTTMWVTVTVVRYRGAPPQPPLSARFGADGGVIGRSPDCDLVLQDPDKAISRRHGEIGADANGFYYADTSTGGTYFFGRDLVLQQNRMALGDGDRFKIGEYELQVRVERQQAASEDPFHPQLTTDPFQQQLSAFEPAPTPQFSVVPQFSESFSAFPFGSSKEPPREPPSPTFIDQPEASPFNESFIPADAATPPVPVQTGDLFQLSAEDLLAGLDEPPSAIPRDAAAFELPDDLFGGEDPFRPSVEAMAAPSTPNAEVPATSDVAEPAALAIPAEERRGSEPPPEVSPFAPPPAKPISPMPAAWPTGSSEGMEPARPREPSVRLSPAETAAPLVPPESPFPAEVCGSSAAPASVGPEITPPPARIPRPGAAQPPAPAASPVSAAPTTAPSDELFRQFLKGAGVSSDLPAAELEQAMFTVGVLFREMVDGLMTVLRARAEVKSQFRVAVTTIRAANNNPLKFTADPGDAIKLLLDPRHPGFIEPRRAVQEGMGDVMNHQLAMTAGIQAALADALKRFHPTVFEKPFEEGLVFQKKAKCWEAYVRAYPELANEVLENIFGETFVEAYERQMQILKGSASNRGPGGAR